MSGRESDALRRLSGPIASADGVIKLKLPQFLTLLVSLKLGRLEGAREQHTDWVLALVALGGMTCTLLSPSSYGQEQVRQPVNAASGQQVFNNVCRTCHTTKEGDNRLGPHLYKIIGRKSGSLPQLWLL